MKVNTIKFTILLLIACIFSFKLHAQTCYVSLSPDNLQFLLSGVPAQTIYVSPAGPPSGSCSNPVITVFTKPSWLNVSISGSAINVSATSTSSFREGSVVIKVNGNIANSFNVRQGTAPPPPPCTISGFGGDAFNPSGETKTYPLTFSNCGGTTNTTLTFSGPSGQSIPNWVTVSQSGSSIVVTTGENNTNGSRTTTIVATGTIGGETVSVGGQISQATCRPPNPSAPYVKNNNCGNTVLERPNPPLDVTWYWQSSSGGTSTSNSSKTITRTTGTVYYLRARNNITGCWSTSSSSVSYTVNQVPSEATGQNNYRCGGAGTVNISATPGNNANSIRWYSASSGGTLLHTGTSYSPNISSTTTYYAQSYNSSTGCVSANRVAVVATVYQVLNAGVVNDVNPVCYNSSAGTLSNATSPSGGNGSYVYQWQVSTNNSSWSNISGATGSTYSPGTLTATRWYRRQVVSCGETKYTPGVEVTVRPDLNPGAINGTNTICSGSNSGTLGNATSPSGGDGNYSYQWQYSNDGSSDWTNISGATASSYLPGTLTSSRWFRRRVTSCSQTKYSSSVEITTTTPPTWYADTDGDSFGNAQVTQQACSQPSGYVSNNTDYDDSTNLITNIPPQYFYKDTDADGFGDPNDMVYRSVQPTGYVTNNTDICPTVSGSNSGCVETPYQAISLSNENYIYTRSYQTPMDNNSGITMNKDVIEQITYFDGLGRPKQSIGIKQSPNETDIVTHIGYDEFGRQKREHLPYQATGTLASFRTNAETATNSHYLAHYASDLDALIPNPFSEKEFEPSPLNRVLKQAAPGEDWELGSGHEIEFGYESNIAGEVRLYTVTLSSTYEPTLVSSGSSYYTAGQLYKTITRDENHSGTTKDHTTEEFKDKQGRVVLKKTYNAGVAHDTYYVYDDYGNLTYVIPPKVDTSNGVSATELAELCYQYRYDHRNRLVEKKIPGKGTSSDWEEIVYNKLDQPILTRDPKLKAEQKWLFTLYDAYGRVAYTGLDTGNSNPRATMQANADAIANQYVTKTATPTTYAGTPVYYTKNAYPNSFDEVHTINYYDNYTFDPAGLTIPTSSIYNQPVATNVKGLATGSKVRVLGTNYWITTITVYDKKGRVIYVASKNEYLGTTDIVETKLDFTGKVAESKTTHTKGSNTPIVTIDSFTYDHAGRLKQQTQAVNGSAVEVIAENTYDELGQLKSKGVGNVASNNSRLQTIDYTYNIRGWLKQINDPASIGNDLFAFRIGYNEGSIPLYNGNIALTQWKTKNTDQSLKTYDYIYDPLNRITGATDNTGNYNLNSIAYDKNGNITALNRQGHIVENPVLGNASHFNVMDNLTYTYDNGNKLTKVADTGNKAHGFKDGTNTNDDFEYDVNGNLTLDRNKGITSVLYNHLNMPTEIKFNNSNTEKINFVYAADRTKLQKITNDNGNVTTTDYAGGYVYENSSLKQITQPEGYIEPNGSSWQYVYRYTDIWGNTRITYADDNGDGMVGTSEIRREQNYYPFGMEHKGYNTAMFGVKNNLKTYQKQEFTEDLGLNTHEWKYRISDPAIGRFWQVDPLAEDYVYNSTYAFQENKVGMGIELEGLELDPWTQTKASTDPNNAKIDKKVYNGVKNMINTSRAMNALLIDFVFGKGTGLRIWGNGSGSGSTRDDGNSSGETVDTNDIPIIGAGGGSVTSKAGKIAKMADTGLELNEAGTQIGEGVNQIRDIFSKDTTVIAQRAGEIESTTVNSSTQATSTGRIINVEVTVPKSKLDSVDQASSNAEQDLEKKMQQANQNALNSYNNE